MFSMIVAIGENREIGVKGKMIWHISSDLQRFKKITMGNPVIMGRKTFDSLPKKPLPGRTNIVLTRDKDFHYEGVQVFHSVEEVLAIDFTGKEPFVIGGEEIYKAFLPYCNKLYLTKIHASSREADAFFPEIDHREWKEVENEAVQQSENTPPYTYLTYVRR